eukprot:snap_masked-scaffold_6-processed-gene-13.37-mRNA-1 protein AED:1.00 eAED:1.00 QI:0/0/0/0/1/1/2/0/388
MSKKRNIIGHKDIINSICLNRFSDAFDTALTSSADGTSRLWTLDRSAQTTSLRATNLFKDKQNSSEISSSKIAYCDNSYHIFQSFSNVLAVYSLNTGDSRIIHSTPTARYQIPKFEDNEISSFDVLERSDFIFVAAADDLGNIYLLKYTPCSGVFDFVHVLLSAHSNIISTVSFISNISSDGEIALLSCGFDQQVQLSKLAIFKDKTEELGVLSLDVGMFKGNDFSKQGVNPPFLYDCFCFQDLIFIAIGDGTVSVLCVEEDKLRPVVRFIGHNGAVFQVQKVLEQEGVLVLMSVGVDAVVRFWNIFPQENKVEMICEVKLSSKSNFALCDAFIQLPGCQVQLNLLVGDLSEQKWITLTFQLDELAFFSGHSNIKNPLTEAGCIEQDT